MAPRSTTYAYLPLWCLGGVIASLHESSYISTILHFAAFHGREHLDITFAPLELSIGVSDSLLGGSLPIFVLASWTHFFAEVSSLDAKLPRFSSSVVLLFYRERTPVNVVEVPLRINIPRVGLLLPVHAVCLALVILLLR